MSRPHPIAICALVAGSIVCLWVFRSHEHVQTAVELQAPLPYSDQLEMAWNGIQWKTTDARFARSAARQDVVTLAITIDPDSSSASGTVVKLDGLHLTIKTTKGIQRVALAKNYHVLIGSQPKPSRERAKDTVLLSVPRSRLHPGVKVFLILERQKHGGLYAQNVSVQDKTGNKLLMEG